jgi:hypothetical protein
MCRPHLPRLAWTDLEAGLRVTANARIHTCVDGRWKRRIRCRDFGGGSGGGMNAEHCGRVLGPASVRLKRAAMCMCRRAPSARARDALARTPGIGVRSG